MLDRYAISQFNQSIITSSRVKRFQTILISQLQITSRQNIRLSHRPINHRQPSKRIIASPENNNPLSTINKQTKKEKTKYDISQNPAYMLKHHNS